MFSAPGVEVKGDLSNEDSVQSKSDNTVYNILYTNLHSLMKTMDVLRLQVMSINSHLIVVVKSWAFPECTDFF